MRETAKSLAEQGGSEWSHSCHHPLAGFQEKLLLPRFPSLWEGTGGLSRRLDEQREPLPRAVDLPGVLGRLLRQLPRKP